MARAREVVGSTTVEDFESSWQSVWLVTRGLEIVSEASRNLPEDLKARHPELPWKKIAGIGNVLRHDYERVAAAILWKVVKDDLPALAAAIDAELERLARPPEPN